jgi:hypothetical protein
MIVRIGALFGVYLSKQNIRTYERFPQFIIIPDDKPASGWRNLLTSVQIRCERLSPF